MRNKKAENQVKQAIAMHPMSSAAEHKDQLERLIETAARMPTEPSSSLHENGYPQEHTHTYLVSEYEEVFRGSGRKIFKAIEYRCSTCLQISDAILKPS